MTDRRKPWRVRLKVWRFVLHVELSYRKDARTNKQIREERERFWANFDRWMKSPNSGIELLRAGRPLDYSTAARNQHRNHVHFPPFG